MMSYYSIQSIELGLRWKEAASINNSNPNESLIEYDTLNRSLTADRSFVLNYGSILYKSEKYRQCVNHFEEKGFLCLTTDQFLMLGECYEKLNNFQKAEENYKDASFLIPHKFVPKYHLFKIYQTMQQPDKAYQEALEIRKMKIKIYSESVKDIKTEVNKYISDQQVNYQSIK
jgi:tetratricopeptide (TPR) repeat protein